MEAGFRIKNAPLAITVFAGEVVLHGVGPAGIALSAAQALDAGIELMTAALKLDPSLEPLSGSSVKELGAAWLTGYAAEELALSPANELTRVLPKQYIASTSVVTR